MESSGDDVSQLDLVKIVEVPGKGLGIVATRDADPGQVVARERSPIAISVDVNHLGARCSRCAGRGPRPSATHRCRNGCGAAWCSPECARVDEALHVDSGECSFLLDIGPHRPEKQGTCQPCGPGDRHTGRRKVDRDWVMLADDVRLLLRAKHGGILEGGAERLAELDLDAECPNSSWEIGGAGSHATLRRIATIAAQTYRHSTGGDAIPEDAEASEASGSLLDDDDDGSWVTAARIVFSNSFDVDAWAMSSSAGNAGIYAYPRVSRVAGAVYRTLSRFNHSCVPNCSWSFVPQGTPGSVGAASVAVRAIKSVKEGDELTISYADPTVRRDERRETLWDKYRFDCACALCASPRNENRQLLGIDPFLEAVHCNVKDGDKDGVIEETERMIHDVRVALRSIQTGEDVKKLDLAVNKLKTKMISRTKPFMKDTEKNGLRWNYAGEGGGDGFHPFNHTSMEALGILGVASSVKAKLSISRGDTGNDAVIKLMKTALGCSMLRAAALDHLARYCEAGFGDAAARAWMEVSERAMTCSALDANGTHTDEDYRQHAQTYLMSNAFQNVVDNDDGVEDGFLFSAAVCLPNPDLDHPIWGSPYLETVQPWMEPPQGIFAIASDVAMNLADFHSPGLVKHIVGAFNAQSGE